MRSVDYHVHSSHSCDGKSSIPEMCQKAVELGIEEIGFSEHMDFEPKDWGYGFFNYERYSSEIEAAQDSFKNKIVIRKGVEIDYQYCFESDVREWIRNKRFDFTIGAVHYLDHEIISHELVKSKDLSRIYEMYFEEVVRSIESRLFDVIGHFDLVSRFLSEGRSEPKSFDYWGGVNTVLEGIIEKKIHLEVNSKGLRETYKDTMPSREIVKEFIRNGGTLVSIGSDAHSIPEIGNGIKEILDFLEECDGNGLRSLFE